MNEPAVPLLELRDGSKSYGAVHALRHGNISLRPGEVRGLVGENGAGKSTLVKVLGGVVRPDEGELLVDGQEASFHSPVDARKVGVAVIYQEPTLFPDLSVAENVVMGRHPRGALQRIDRGAMHEEVQGLLDPGPRPVDRGSADRRNRKGALLRRPRTHHGRADGRALGA